MNDNDKTPIAASMESFFTRDRAAAGTRLDLTDPVGRKTEHWLHVIGVDSDEFKLADAAAKRHASELSLMKDGPDKDRMIMDMQRELTAKLVTAWSFDKEFNHAAVVEFFRQAPQIQRAVDVAATRRALFFKDESAHS